MSFFVSIANFLGFFSKFQKWLQGKKTYTINILQILAGLCAILALAGQILDLVAKTLSLISGWGDSGQDASAIIETIKALWANHAALIAGFSAAFYSITDACSKMASYAAKRRENKK
jgi:hypothetical protein